MRYNFTIRIYKDKNRHPALTDLQNITISDITIISKPTKTNGICEHNSNKKKFGYIFKLSTIFNKISGSHSYPTLSFNKEYIDIMIENFPRYPAFYQDKYFARNCLNEFGYTNTLNNGFPHQLLYRTIQILNLTKS